MKEHLAGFLTMATMSHAMLNFEGSGGGQTNHYAASSV